MLILLPFWFFLSFGGQDGFEYYLDLNISEGVLGELLLLRRKSSYLILLTMKGFVRATVEGFLLTATGEFFLVRRVEFSRVIGLMFPD